MCQNVGGIFCLLYIVFMKDWDKIVRELSSPEASDAEDDLNVVSVQKNAKRVVELLQGTIPGMQCASKAQPPLGMNEGAFKCEHPSSPQLMSNEQAVVSSSNASNVLAQEEVANAAAVAATSKRELPPLEVSPK